MEFQLNCGVQIYKRYWFSASTKGWHSFLFTHRQPKDTLRPYLRGTDEAEGRENGS